MENHCADQYYLRGAGPLDGVLRRSHEDALRTVVRSDGLTNQERGMVDRVLYPKTGKGKKYVRRIRRHRGRTCCDMISEEAQTETQPLAQLLQTYRCDEPQMAGGRHRNAALPDDIADRLHVLRMPASMSTDSG